jgi:hypothetical protein
MIASGSTPPSRPGNRPRPMKPPRKSILPRSRAGRSYSAVSTSPPTARPRWSICASS